MNTFKTFIVSIFIASLLTSPVSAANSGTYPSITHENPVFQTISDYEFTLTPITGGLICYRSFGKTGLVLGLLIGTVDEYLAWSGITSKRHMTAGLLGMSMGSMLGFLSSALLSSEVIEVDSEALTSPISGMVSGASFAHAYGQSGALFAFGGLSAGLFDKHMEGAPLVNTLHAVTTSKVLSPVLAATVQYIPYVGNAAAAALRAPYVAESAGVVIAAVLFADANREDAIEGVNTPEKLKSLLEDTFERITESDVTSQMSKNQVTYKIAMAALRAQCDHYLSTLSQGFSKGLQTLSPLNQDAQLAFSGELKKYALFLIPHILRIAADRIVSDYQAETLKRTLSQGMRKKLMYGETPLRLKSNASIIGDVQAFDANLQLLGSTGMSMIWSATDSYTRALHSTLLLYKAESLDVVTFLEMYTKTLEKALQAIEKQISELNQQSQEIGAQVQRLEQDIKKEAKVVTHGRHLDYLHRKMSELKKKEREISARIYKWKLVSQVLFPVQFLSDTLISFGLVSHKVTEGKLPTEQSITTSNAAIELVGSGNWYLTNGQAIAAINLAQASVKRVLDFVDSPCDLDSTLARESIFSTTNSISLKNFEVGVIEPRKKLVQTKGFDLSAGRYVISGKAGSGKSSFLSKIRGVTCNGLYAHGTLTFASKDARDEVYEVTQTDYIPPFSTLIEILTGQTKEELRGNEEIRERAKALLLELEIDDQGDKGIVSALDEVRDWPDILSGGQKRKVALTAMLLKKPNFVILDETFAGLDNHGIQIAQALIRRELPDSVIIVVDHKAKANNFDSFYDAEINLSNKELTRFEELSNPSTY